MKEKIWAKDYNALQLQTFWKETTILIKVDAAAKIIENHDKEFVSVKGNKKSKSVNSR